MYAESNSATYVIWESDILLQSFGQLHSWQKVTAKKKIENEYGIHPKHKRSNNVMTKGVFELSYLKQQSLMLRKIKECS